MIDTPPSGQKDWLRLLLGLEQGAVQGSFLRMAGPQLTRHIDLLPYTLPGFSRDLNHSEKLKMASSQTFQTFPSPQTVIGAVWSQWSEGIVAPTTLFQKGEGKF